MATDLAATGAGLLGGTDPSAAKRSPVQGDPGAASVRAERDDRDDRDVDWLYARIYCGGGDDTDALLPGIARWVDEARADWPVRSVHFLRFVDLRGHHVRLRLQADPDALDELFERLDILDAAPARTPIIVECMDTSNDIIADYWVYDQKMMQYLLGRYGAAAPKRVIVATNGTLNAARQKAKADAALRVLPRLAYKPSGPWTAEDIGALKAVDMIACRSNDTSKPEVLAAIKNHPEKPGLWWAGMTTAAHVDAARAASSAAGLAIEGWIMEAKEAAPGALSTALPVRP